MELLERAGCGDLYGVERLIQQGVDVDTMNCCNETALYLACKNGHTEVAQYLLDNGASVNLGDDKPLLAAVKYNHYDCVELLLKYHPDVNSTNTEQESLVSVTLQEHPDDIKLILLLLQYDAIPSASLASDMSVQLLKHAKEKHAKAIQKLIDENFINLTVESTFLAAFDFAFQRGSVELAEKILWSECYSYIEQLYPEAVYYSAKNSWPSILSKLIEKGANVNALCRRRRTQMHASCKEGHKCYKSACSADPNYSCDYFSLPPLHFPVLYNDKPTVEMFLSAGADINAMESGGATPLFMACFIGNAEIVQLLLSRGASPNVGTGGRCTWYPIQRACRGLHYDVVKMLMEYNADVNVRSESGENALHCAVSDDRCRDSDKRSHLVQLLLNAGVDVNEESHKGETPFYIACSKGLASVAEKMLESGAKIDGNSGKKVPLNAACRSKR